MSAGDPHPKPIVLVPVRHRLATDGNTRSTAPASIPRGLYENGHSVDASAREVAGVPPLAYFCLRILIDYPDQLHSLGSHRIRCQPQVLRALSPSTFSDVGAPAHCLCKLDPRLWSVITQVYTDLPKGLQNYHIPLGDRHLPLLQAIPSTPSFALITVLNLARCVSDETSHALKTLHGLCALDISQTSITHLGIRHFAPTITSEPSDARYGTRGLRILRLCDCLEITDQVISAVSNFQLLATLDLRGTSCDRHLDLGVFRRSSKSQRNLFQCSLQDALQRLGESDSRNVLFSHPNPFVIHINRKFHPRWPERPNHQPAPDTHTHERLPYENSTYSALYIPDPERKLREWIRTMLGDAGNEPRISEIADFVMQRWDHSPGEVEYDSYPGCLFEADDSVESWDEEENSTESRIDFCGYEVHEDLVERVSEMVKEMREEHEEALQFYGLDPRAQKANFCHCEELRCAAISLAETIPTDRYLMLVRDPPPWDSVYGPDAPPPQKIRLATKLSLFNSPNFNLDRSSLRARKSTQEMSSMIAQRRGLPTAATPSNPAPTPPVSTNPFRKVSGGGSARGELKGLHRGRGDPAQGGRPDSVPDNRTPKRIRPISQFPVPPRPTPPTNSQSQRAKSGGGSRIEPKKPGKLKQTTLLGVFGKQT